MKNAPADAWSIKTRTFLGAIILLAVSVLPALAQSPAPAAPPQPADLQVPDGFKVSVFASDVTSARLMAFGPDGVLIVARQGKGDVVALPDRNGDGRADKMEVIASNLNRPHSVAFHQGWLYIATMPAVLRGKYVGGKIAGAPEKIIDLPVSSTPHFTRTIAFGRDGRLYVAIGSSCNSCEETDERRTTSMQYNADGSGGKPFARGFRYAIGFDWDASGVMWAGDMGQDKLGEEVPPDEINRVEAGKHYGWPYFIGRNAPNPDLKEATGSMPAAQAVPPAYELPAHISPIGLTVYKGRKFPAAYRNSLFIALHGSSGNARAQKIGYKVARAVLKNGQITGLEDFVTGWLKDGQVLGRPAGMAVGPDGALYISDDSKGFIYRVTYGK